MEHANLLVRQLAAVADLLLGVAHADGRLDAVEAAEIRSKLRTFTNADALSELLEARIGGFDPAEFDLHEAVAAVQFNDLGDRLRLLELVRDVLDADRIRDQREESYFFAVAEALGVADVAGEILSRRQDPQPI